MHRPVSLVTGCAGFIGSHVARELLAMGHIVVGLDDLSGGFAENHPEGMLFYHGSVTDTILVNGLFEQYGFQHVYHLAAGAVEGISHSIRPFNYDNLLTGSINLITASLQSGTVMNFVYTSAASVYGDRSGPIDETMVPQPEDPFSIAKYAVELDLRSAQKRWGLNYTIFRPHQVYGEHQYTGPTSRNLIGAFLRQAMLGKTLMINSDGSAMHAFRYISDVAPVIAHAGQRTAAYNRTFNLGGNLFRSERAVAEIVSSAVGTERNFQQLHLPATAPSYIFSQHAVKTVFRDLIQDVPVETGIERMAAWMQQTGLRSNEIFAHVDHFNRSAAGTIPVMERHGVIAA